MRVGYARVSGTRQEVGSQVSLLTEYGCTQVFSEAAKGTDRVRPALRQAMNEAIDIAHGMGKAQLVVVRLDRLSRSLPHGREVMEELSEAGVELISLQESLDFSTPAGLYAGSLLLAAAEFEVGSKTSSIMEAKRIRGPQATGGRPRSLTPGQVAQATRLREHGLTNQQVANHLGVSRSTLVRSLRRLRTEAS